jgi:hypothetical protein
MLGAPVIEAKAPPHSTSACGIINELSVVKQASTGFYWKETLKDQLSSWSVPTRNR